MRIVNWNIQRNRPSSWKAKSLIGEIRHLHPDLVCLTEAWASSLEELDGYSISASGVAWSVQKPDERKVLLWSQNPWRQVEVPEELNSIGCAVAGLTRIENVDVRVVGICVPYAAASPLGTVPRVSPWVQHEAFLRALAAWLPRWRDQVPLIVIGDFNRRMPRGKWGSKRAYQLLEDTFADYQFATMGDLPEVGGRTVDHVVVSDHFSVEKTTARSAEDETGRIRSDHFGVVVDLRCDP